jgi:hypothetical protein
MNEKRMHTHQPNFNNRIRKIKHKEMQGSPLCAFVSLCLCVESSFTPCKLVDYYFKLMPIQPISCFLSDLNASAVNSFSKRLAHKMMAFN